MHDQRSPILARLHIHPHIFTQTHKHRAPICGWWQQIAASRVQIRASGHVHTNQKVKKVICLDSFAPFWMADMKKKPNQKRKDRFCIRLDQFILKLVTQSPHNNFNVCLVLDFRHVFSFWHSLRSHFDIFFIARTHFQTKFGAVSRLGVCGRFERKTKNVKSWIEIKVPGDKQKLK